MAPASVPRAGATDGAHVGRLVIVRASIEEIYEALNGIAPERIYLFAREAERSWNERAKRGFASGLDAHGYVEAYVLERARCERLFGEVVNG